jgi:hypothetical protein
LLSFFVSADLGDDHIFIGKLNVYCNGRKSVILIGTYGIFIMPVTMYGSRSLSIPTGDVNYVLIN